MFSLNRRNMLLGMASASAAAASVLAAEPVAASIVPENLELLALGEQLPAVAAEMVASGSHYWAVVSEWGPKLPRPPEALVAGYDDPHDWERDLIGFGICPDGERYTGQASDGRPRTIMTAERLAADLRHTRRRDERAHLSDLLALARTFEAERAAVVEASGFVPVRQRQTLAMDAVADLVERIMRQRPETMVGVLIQAEALTAWSRAPYHRFDVRGFAWPDAFAANLLRIAGGSAAEQA